MDDCLLWWGACARGSYGRFRTYTDGTHRVCERAHRRIYEECFGPIPDGCCHQWSQGTDALDLHREGCRSDEERINRDMVAKGRNKSGNAPCSLSPRDIAEMRRLREAGESVASLCREFGIHRTTVKRILGLKPAV